MENNVKLIFGAPVFFLAIFCSSVSFAGIEMGIDKLTL